MKINKCRICNEEKLFPYLNLGNTPAADSFVDEDGLKNVDPTYPLEVCLCENCGISQLNFTVSPSILYKYDYPYESSITFTGREHFYKFAESVVNKLKITNDELVIDIGSNVGVLLMGFKENGCRTLGIEPSGNIAKKAIDNGINTINEFISLKLAEKIVNNNGKASVVCITNVFAHIHDLEDFMQAVNVLLSENGTLIIEAPHFLQLVNNLEYDTIYHEHLLYISIKPLNLLFNRFGFSIYDVEEFPIHGGTVRIYVTKNHKIETTQAVKNIIMKENQGGIFIKERLLKFSDDVVNHRHKLRSLLIKLKFEGYNLAGVSAPAKGMTLLNYCGIDKEVLDFISEKSILKVGRYTPGGHIPVISDEELISRKPDFVLLLAWNFADEIIKNLEKYQLNGGKFIIPIPEPKII